MKENHLYYLLRAISKNSSARFLIRKGMSYAQIAEYTRAAIQSELLTNSDERIILTPKGQVLLKQLEITYKKTNKDKWIDKFERGIVAKIDNKSLYLPKQDELTF